MQFYINFRPRKTNQKTKARRKSKVDARKLLNKFALKLYM